MARFTRIEVAVTMKQCGVVPLFFHHDSTICNKIVHACHDGGIRVIEFTNRGDFAHEVFSELVKYCAEKIPDMIIGAGSVVDPATAALFIQSGAEFIVSPLLNEAMAKICNRRKIVWIPGCATLSEIGRAEELGAEICKLFPCDPVQSPSLMNAIKGPCPRTNIMPTGGVTTDEENLRLWFDAGAYCVGMGSKLITKEIIAHGDFVLLKKNIKKVLACVQEIRGEG